jgi:predicted aspartyl protease
VRTGACLIFCLALVAMPVKAADQKQSEVSFRLIDGWAVVVQGTLGGAPNHTILIDTGAVPSAISRKAAVGLGLQGAAENVSVLNRAIEVERVRVPSVQIGAVSVAAIEMVATDLGPIEQALHTHLDAVIGLDVLGRQNFTIDYRNRKLLFRAGIHTGHSIPFEVKHAAGGTYLLIPMESGSEKFQMLLDTGTRDITLFRARLKGGLRQVRIDNQDLNFNAGGVSETSRVVIPFLRVGSISRRKQDVYVWETRDGELRDFDGMVGPTALGADAVEFDFDSSTVILRNR